MREALVELAGNIAGSISASFNVFLCTVVAVKTLEWLEVIQ
jgi:hypothetical protein